jgi:hypothetical protein
MATGQTTFDKTFKIEAVRMPQDQRKTLDPTRE